MPTDDNFALKELDLPPLGEGRCGSATSWLSVDPYMRGRMNDVKSYVPPFQLGEPMEGGAVGEVVESKAEGFAPGDIVLHMARLARRGGGSTRARSTSCPTSARRPRRSSAISA